MPQLLILDGKHTGLDGQTPGSGDLVCDFGGADASQLATLLKQGCGRVDLSEMLRTREKELKERYLEFVYRFPFQKIGVKTVFEHLDRDGVNYWWSTLIAEKNILKKSSRAVIKTFKLLLLEELIVQRKVTGLGYVGGDAEVAKTLKDLASACGIGYWDSLASNGKKSILQNIKNNTLLNHANGLAKHLYRVMACKRLSNVRPVANCTLLTYFPNLEDEASPVYTSRYFKGLHDVLNGVTLDYLFFYVANPRLGFRDAVDKVKTYRAGNSSTYALIEEHLGVSGLMFTVVKSFREAIRNKKLLDRELFQLPGGNLNLYFLLRDEWETSISGTVYLRHRILGAVFDAICKERKGKNLIYLMEMQGWETVLTQTAKRYGVHTVGTVHALIKPMMLKFFNDPRTYSDEKYPYPLPDEVGVNGPLSKASFLEQGIAAKRLVDIEAQRFMHLKKTPRAAPEGEGTLLVVTPINREEALEQLIMLRDAYGAMRERVKRIWIKPHPFFDVGSILKSLQGFPEYEIKYGNINEYLYRVEWVFVANSSSVLFESIVSGKKTITFNTLSQVNLAAVTENELLRTVTNATGLSSAVKGFDTEGETSESADFLNLDSDFKQWKQLLQRMR